MGLILNQGEPNALRHMRSALAATLIPEGEFFPITLMVGDFLTYSATIVAAPVSQPVYADAIMFFMHERFRITDPDTSLASLVAQHGFSQDFTLVPASAARTDEALALEKTVLSEAQIVPMKAEIYGFKVTY